MAHRSQYIRTQRKAKQVQKWGPDMKKPSRGRIPDGLKSGNNKAYSDAVRGALPWQKGHRD